MKKITNKTGKKRQFEIAKKILSKENKDAAFFIIYDDSGNFRFSFVKANLVEAKKYSTIEKDRNHVMDIMADHNYQYKYGLLVSYYENVDLIQCELFSFENTQFVITAFGIRK